MPPTLGLYVSVPFCRAKCSFCNFSSDSYAPGLLPQYLATVAAEIAAAPTRAQLLAATLPSAVDTVYLGGGTPSLLSPEQVATLFTALRHTFPILSDAEITAECAPLQLSPETLAAMQHHGVNRLSFGVQSFIDQESAAVGRRHTARQCLDEIARAQRAGISDVGLDLIAGLPHQTEASWRESLQLATASGATHISIYLLELDDGSRLGREALAGGSRYGAAALPDEALTADLYQLACDHLAAAGFDHYEISNFARPGLRSRHNSRYWSRQPYLGFGLDAHSMLPTPAGHGVRFANTDDLSTFLAQPATGLNLLPANPAPAPTYLTLTEALEETLFLGLRRSEGVSRAHLRQHFPADLLAPLWPVLADATADGLLQPDPDHLRLTPNGRLLSNELFSRLLLDPAAATAA